MGQGVKRAEDSKGESTWEPGPRDIRETGQDLRCLSVRHQCVQSPSHGPPPSPQQTGDPPRNCKHHNGIRPVPEWEAVSSPPPSHLPDARVGRGGPLSPHLGLCRTHTPSWTPHVCPGSHWGAEGSRGTQASPLTPVQPSHCPGRVTAEVVSECRGGSQEGLGHKEARKNVAKNPVARGRNT